MMPISNVILAEGLRSYETAGEKVLRLEAEARAAAREEVDDLKDALGEVVLRCLAAAKMTTLPNGEREVLRKLAEQIETSLTTVQAIGARA